MSSVTGSIANNKITVALGDMTADADANSSHEKQAMKQIKRVRK